MPEMFKNKAEFAANYYLGINIGDAQGFKPASVQGIA